MTSSVVTVDHSSVNVQPTVVRNPDRSRQITVLAWAPHSRRSQLLAEQLGADMHFVHYLRESTPWLAPIRYPLQMIKTLWILRKTRPSFVIAQNPPFLCGLAVYLHGRFHAVRYALDWHSAAFERAWEWAVSIQRLLARRAVVNIVTSQHWQSLVESWGATATVLSDVPLEFPSTEPYPVQGDFAVAMVSTFSPDEPLDAILEAALQLPEIRFYITGDTNRKPRGVLDRTPANVTFTGFLPDNQYLRLLQSVDAIMSLTTRNHTMQLGGCEAVWLGQPLITSDWPLLRETFHHGTVHVANTVGGIRGGVLAVRARREELAREMKLLQDERRQMWDGFARQVRQLALGSENPLAQAGSEP
jgi:glycosyltransferase involved in cell wall biosynthesis